jgi:basic membrane protein A
MMKGVDVAVFETTRRVAEGGFEGGTEIFGLKEKGVGYVYDEHNKSQDGPDARLYLSPEDIEAVEALKEKIVAGEIKVPTTPAK